MKPTVDIEAILKELTAKYRPELPSAGAIWFRAQMRRKARERERIERPMRVMEVIVALNGFLVLLTAVGDNWATIRQGARLLSGGLLVLFVLTLVAVVVSTAIAVRQSEHDQQSQRAPESLGLFALGTRLHPRSPYSCGPHEACLGRHRCARGNRVPGYVSEDAQWQDHTPVAESPGIGRDVGDISTLEP